MYNFGGNTNLTPETLAQRRGLAQAMMQGLGRSPQTAAEGWNDASGKIVGALLARQAQKQEDEKRGAATQQFQQLFGRTPIAYQAPQGVPADAMPPGVPGTPKGGSMPSGDAEWLKYSNQNAVRSQPISTELKSAMSFLPEMGISMEVFSGGQPNKGESDKRAGSTRHDGGHAADVFFYKDGRRLSWESQSDIPVLQEIVTRAKSAGLTGFGAGQGYMQPGSMHIGFGTPAAWGADGKGVNAPDWLRDAYNGAGGGGGGSAPSQPAYSGPAMNDIMQMLSNPWIDQSQRQVLMAQLQMAQQASDPMRSVQMTAAQLANQKTQAEIDAMSAPAPQYRQMTGAQLGMQGPAAEQMFNVGPDGKVTSIGGGGTNISLNTGSGPKMGTLAQDYGYIRDADGNVVIDPETGLAQAAVVPGSKTDLELQAERAQADRAKKANNASDTTRADVVTQTTNSIRQKLQSGGLFDLPEAGVLGERLGRWGVNQEAADLSTQLETLKGMVTFDRLAKLREASTNGSSGLGQVTNVEIGLLSSQLGALDQRSSPELMMQTLDTIDSVFGKLSPEAAAYLMGETDNLPGAGSAQPDTQASADFSGMDQAALMAVDIMSLSPADQDAWEARMNELGL